MYIVNNFFILYIELPEIFCMDNYTRRAGPKRKPALAARRAERTSDCGFTLVEALIAVMISSVLTMVLLAMLRMNNDSVKNGAVNAKIRSQYEIAIAEIGTYTRRAHAVLSGVEPYPPDTSFRDTATSKIIIYEDTNGTGIPIRGFCVEDGQFKEWKPGWSDYKSFVVGKWPTVSVLDTAPFLLSANRRTVKVSMRVSGVFAGVTAVTPARGEVFICRN
jgi:prepilin-type N-terminal cleavage/methylation domain-containing protein